MLVVLDTQKGEGFRSDPLDRLLDRCSREVKQCATGLFSQMHQKRMVCGWI